jgi:hypothetical protein
MDVDDGVRPDAQRMETMTMSLNSSEFHMTRRFAVLGEDGFACECLADAEALLNQQQQLLGAAHLQLHQTLHLAATQTDKTIMQ